MFSLLVATIFVLFVSAISCLLHELPHLLFPLIVKLYYFVHAIRTPAFPPNRTFFALLTYFVFFV